MTSTDVRVGLENIIKTCGIAIGGIALAWAIKYAVNYEYIVIKDFKYVPKIYSEEGDLNDASIKPR